MDRVADLVETCTTVVWLGSAYHAAISFGQYDYQGFVPNGPSLTTRPVPAARCARPAAATATATGKAQAEAEVARAVAEAVNDTAAVAAAVFIEVGAVADAAAALASPASASPKKSRLPPLSRSRRTRLHRVGAL